MPRISEFYGIVITMYHNDHGLPHFHAKYGGHEAKFLIATGDVIDGGVPVRIGRLVRQWLRLHEAELNANWQLARADQPLVRIDPLP